MRKLLATLVVIVTGISLNAANVTIAKSIRIDVGGKYFPLGCPTNLINSTYPLNDGGYLVTYPFSTNSALIRFTSAGGLVWSNCFALLESSQSAFAELQEGRLAFLQYRLPPSAPRDRPRRRRVRPIFPAATGGQWPAQRRV